MKGTQRKVVIISLDGATFDILNPLMEQERLPNLRRLREKGMAVPLASIIPPVTPPAWTSFMTGKHPAKHGIFGFMHFDPQSYAWRIANSQYVRSKTIWQILSDKGKEVIVLNLPQTYPPYPVNGVMVSGWDSVPGNFTYPPELGREILETMPDCYDSELWMQELFPATTRKDFDHFVSKLESAARQSTTLALRLLDRRSWDVFMIHFHQTDWMQHKLWPDIERACDPRNTDYRSERVRQCYQRLDECVGAIIGETAADEPLIVVVSDHGFGPHRGSIHVNHYLHSWGYLQALAPVPQKGAFEWCKSLLRESRFAPLRRLYTRLAHARHAFDNEDLAASYKQQFKSWVDMSTRNSGQRGRNIDWGKTQVAVIEQYKCAFLYVNVIGKGPLGMVQPGEQYEAIVSDLITRFSDIRHPVTGEKLLAQVARCRDIYPQLNPEVELPDMVLVPAEGYDFASDLTNVAPQPTSEGIHHPTGILFLQGGELERSQTLQPALVDLAPTVLHYLGLPVPSDMDGRVLEEAFPSLGRASFEQVNNAVELGEPVLYTAKESSLIEQRLRGLGYIE